MLDQGQKVTLHGISRNIPGIEGTYWTWDRWYMYISDYQGEFPGMSQDSLGHVGPGTEGTYIPDYPGHLELEGICQDVPG